MFPIIYRIALELYYYAVLLVAFFIPKADTWLAGQRQTWLHLHKAPRNEHRPTLWIHCASLGEFEQGRPIIETVKAQFPATRILLTFFSPSGYEIRQNYPLVDEVHYLPFDTPDNVQLWLAQKQPTIAIFVKYEFWYNYLQQLHSQQIPTYLIAANFRPEQVFFKWYGGFFRNMLPLFTQLFVQNQSSVEQLKTIQQTAIIAGDTRFDRVLTKAEQPQSLPIIQQFKGRQTLVVAGSTWEQDELELVQLINQTADEKVQNIQWIIAPHEPNDNHLATLEQLLAVSHVRYSQWHGAASKAARVLIIDSIGLLADIYQYADYAYIGGGFGKGIHNILEAAVFGMPIFFGANYNKFEEAKDLVAQQGAFVVENSNMLHSYLLKMEINPDLRQKSATICRQYVLQHRGATQKIMQILVKHFQ